MRKETARLGRFIESFAHIHDLLVRNAKNDASPDRSETRVIIGFSEMLMKGIEPPAYALRVRCSTPELHQRVDKVDKN